MSVFPTNLPDRTGSPLGFMTGGNFARGLLSAGLNAGVTTAQVNFDPVAAGYPTTGYLIISRGGAPREVVKYGGRSASGGNPGSFTSLTRGQAGTSDQAHVSGDEIGMGLFYGVIDDIISELVAGLTKLGYGSSTPSTTGHVLKQSGSGQSAWGLLGHEYVTTPYCQANTASGTTQSFSSGVLTQVGLDSEVADAWNMFPGPYGSSIKVPYAGLWDFYASAIFNASGITGPISLAFYNATTANWFGTIDYYFSNRLYPGVLGSARLSVAANDEIVIFVLNNVGSTLTTFSGSSGAGPVFIANFVGPA